VLEALACVLVESRHPELAAESLGTAAVLLEQVGTSRRGGGTEEMIRDEAILRLHGVMESEELEAAIRRRRDTPFEVALRRAFAALD
jgi:hypothetical protein